MEQNIRTLQAEAPDIYFGIDITVSIFNVLRIPEFYKYMVEQRLVQPDRVNLYLLFDPHEQSIRNLPPAMKQTVVALYDDFDKNYLASLPGSARIREHSRAVVATTGRGLSLAKRICRYRKGGRCLAQREL
ncbi:MAG: hypothetical protein IPN29_02100 [Saprospiraceae bacterium]|nr:hypothetical protein [Saprospiraceae bacterium]